MLERSRFFSASLAYEPLNGLAIGLLVLAVAQVTHANLVLAAFSAGITVATFGPRQRTAFEHFGENIAELFELAALWPGRRSGRRSRGPAIASRLSEPVDSDAPNPRGDHYAERLALGWRRPCRPAAKWGTCGNVAISNDTPTKARLPGKFSWEIAYAASMPSMAATNVAINAISIELMSARTNLSVANIVR